MNADDQNLTNAISPASAPESSLAEGMRELVVNSPTATSLDDTDSRSPGVVERAEFTVENLGQPPGKGAKDAEIIKQLVVPDVENDTDTSSRQS
jgi:hypothetical protein